MTCATAACATASTAPGIIRIEVAVNNLLSDVKRANEVSRVAREAEESLRDGTDVVIFTSRTLVTGASAEDNLSISKQVSQGVAEIVRSIAARPRYMLAKGGETASGIATHVLNVKRAMTPGQILPGVPVWELAVHGELRRDESGWAFVSSWHETVVGARPGG